jgi:mono/diheme cytochrome c family protein
VSRTNIVFRFLLFPLGVALLIAASLIQEGIALTVELQSTPEATLSPFERLAEPTLPAAPSQADHGAQTYWLLCLACHGDRGQGLTDEFRETYPPEEQYCWERGCHGERPYDYGFTLPMQIPAVMGPEAALGKFTTAARLNAYIMAAMPYWKPGSLTEEEGWLVTSFILRENGIQFDKNLDDSNAEEILLSALQLFPTPVPETSSENVTQQAGSINFQWLFALALVVIIIVVAAVSLRRRSTE